MTQFLVIADNRMIIDGNEKRGLGDSIGYDIDFV